MQQEDTENLFEYEVLRDRLESLQKDQKCVAFQAQVRFVTSLLSWGQGVD